MVRDRSEHIARCVGVFEILRIHNPAWLISSEDGFDACGTRMVPIEAGEDQSANVASREIVIEAFLDLLGCDVVAFRHVRVNNHSLVAGPDGNQRSLS